MAQAARKLRTLAGSDINTKGGDHPVTPPNAQDLAIAIKQLQDSLNELIVRFNAHTHSGVTVGAGSTGVGSSLVNGTAQAPASLFVNADS